MICLGVLGFWGPRLCPKITNTLFPLVIWGNGWTVGVGVGCCWKVLGPSSFWAGIEVFGDCAWWVSGWIFVFCVGMCCLRTCHVLWSFLLSLPYDGFGGTMVDK